jgi:hypothetical protein
MENSDFMVQPKKVDVNLNQDNQFLIDRDFDDLYNGELEFVPILEKGEHWIFL